jgi:hypothetical protein
MKIGYGVCHAVLGLARSLAAIEGRKAVVYFAEAWHLPVGVQPVYDDVVSAANRANVAIHTVDARGLTSHKPRALTPIDSILDRFTADYQRGSGAPVLGEAGGVPGREPGLRAKMEPMEERLSGPRLERLSQDTSPEVPVFVAVYPGRHTDPVELTVAFERDGREIARATPELGPADSEGRIAWIGSVPAAQFGAGSYRIVVTARQGEALAEEETQFDLAPATLEAPAPVNAPVP